MPSFIEKVGGSLDRGFKAVGAAGKEFLETSRLKKEIEETEKAAEDRYTALGKHVYDMLGKGGLDEPALRQEVEGIALLFKRISELNLEIARIEDLSAQRTHGAVSVACSKCGAANRREDRFCGRCGTHLGAPAVVRRACSSCGNAVKESARFCNKCGKDLA